jgi:hypothetical protein
LRSFDQSGLAAGWLAYLARFAPQSGVTQQEGDQARDRAIASLGEDGSLVQQAPTEPDTPPDDPDLRLLSMLRLLIENDAQNNLLPCAHLFLFKQHPELAISAFGGFWYSSRDAGAPRCEPPDGLFMLPAWRLLDAAFSGPINKVMRTMGSIGYGSLATHKAEAIVADLFPSRLIPEGEASFQQGLTRLNAWRDVDLLPQYNIERALAAVPLVERETTAWIIQQRGLSPAEATMAARGMIGEFLNTWLDFLRNPEGITPI